MRSEVGRDLLEHARKLAKVDPNRPRQVHLRRALSAAYYAVFHFLIEEATGLVSGRGYRRRQLRYQLARSFEHRRMRIAAQEVGRFTVPPGGAGPVPATLVECSLSFVRLQLDRHLADYDQSRTFGREEVLTKLEAAEQILERWPSIRRHPATEAFLLALLVKPRA